MKLSKTFVFPSLLGFALAMVLQSGARTKQSGTVQCKTESEQTLEVGDRPGHALAISKSSCTWTTPMEMAGSQTNEGTSVASVEIMGDKSRVHGYHKSTLANGDKCYVRLQGTGTVKDSKPETDEGTWIYTGGTASLKGKANPDGSITYTIEGEYEVPAKAAAKKK